MKKIFTLLLVALAFSSTSFAEENTGVKLKITSNDWQEYECLLSKVDSVKFIVDEDNRDYIVDGALTAASYKVSDSRSVYFSQGNLQFNAMQGTHKTVDGTAKGTWRFAEKQYECIGSINEKISENYDGWIDLFGWGTSGWNSGAIDYQPWTYSFSTNTYYPGGYRSNNLTGAYANADWGVYNAISNGGNEPNRWRTLTASEWKYLFQNSQWTLGYIRNNNGTSRLCFMLVPKEFAEPEGVTVTVLTTGYDSVPSTNKYSAEQFAALEKSGVVALPCGGERISRRLVIEIGSEGHYWSSSDAYESSSVYYDSGYAYNFCYALGVGLCQEARCYGESVRLVQDVP